ncbi:MAG: hypothetical protein S4CHLAM2_06660 [Chlamydiales bacterium]|nr:hypothetical protein [Chlamydiales bacterium]
MVLETIRKEDILLGADEAHKKSAVHQAKEKKQENGSGVDPLILAYSMIFHAVQINHETASIKSKEVQANAVAQNRLIDREGAFNFYTLTKHQLFAPDVHINIWNGGHYVTYAPKTVAQTDLTQLNTKNQEIAALRNQLGDKLTVLQQGSQIKETEVNTVMSEDQQAVSQGSSLMNMLVSLSNQISQI